MIVNKSEGRTWKRTALIVLYFVLPSVFTGMNNRLNDERYAELNKDWLLNRRYSIYHIDSLSDLII
jgi:hypothetical protein